MCFSEGPKYIFWGNAYAYMARNIFPSVYTTSVFEDNNCIGIPP